MMKKLMLTAGLLGALASGSAFAACSATNTAAGDAPAFNPATPNTPGGFGTPTAPAITQNTCICDGLAQKTQINGGGGLTVDPAVARFIKNGFTVTCSANSMVSMSDLATNRFAIAGASRRGNQMHIGNSATGSVRVEARAGGARSCGTGANDPLCTNGDVSAALGRSEDEVPAP